MVEEAKQKTSEILVFANITHDGVDVDGWQRLSRRFVDAGADVIELNMCCPNMSYNVSITGETSTEKTGASLGTDTAGIANIVTQVVDSVSVPVVVKLTPEDGRIAETASAAIEAGADAVGSTANRLGKPDIDIFRPEQSIYRLQDQITLGCLSGPWIRPLALRDTFEIRNSLGPSPFVFASGGISDLQSSVQQLMAGADALWVCTEVMLRGFTWLPKLLDDLRDYMKEMGFSKLLDIRDSLKKIISTAPTLTIRDGFASIDQEKCKACGVCRELGHCLAITQENETPAFVDRMACTGCSTCVDLCSYQAIQMVEA